MLTFYRTLINLVFLLSPIIIIFRFLKKKEHRKRFKEKIGFFKKYKSNKKLIWFHGASLGELQSVVPLIKNLEKTKKIDKILVTSNTLSSSSIISQIKFKKVIHQFFPIDTNFLTKRFINHWKPSLALFIDSEIWPNTLINLKKNGIPIVLINARITKKSYSRWFKIKNFSKFVFSNINLFLCSNKETVNFLKKLGAKNIKYFGNLKYSQIENEKNDINIKILKFFSKRTVWCASSTHNGEEEFVGMIHNKLKKKYKKLLTVIIPRHIDREYEIKDKLHKLGLNVHMHEPQRKINDKTDIYLVNSFGKTKSFYSVIKNVFLGGSLVQHGGQNPLEAARYDCNIIHGPNVSNFTEVYKYLGKQGISKKVYSYNQVIKILDKNFTSKISKQINIKNTIKLIGKNILKKNIYEINLILSKI